jgi:hypothetical protein
MRRLTLFFALAGMLLARQARAQVDPWEFEVYPVQTLGKGVLEIESLNSVVADGHSEGDAGTSSGTFKSQGMWRTSVELTYGITDKIEAAAYLLLAKPDGASFQYAGSKFRLRGMFFDPGQYFVDLGWYVEMEVHKTPQFDDAKLELEVRPIIEKDVGRVQLIAEPIFEKPLVGEDTSGGFEFGYIAAAYYSLWREFSPGVEFYGGIGLMSNTDPIPDQQHYVFPVIRGYLPYGLEYNFGVGIGLTRGSDQVITKLNIEFEHFIGTLF